MIHRLKTWPSYWQAIDEGRKNFEVRRDDRGFQVGDLLILECFDPKNGVYVLDYTDGSREPKRCTRRITYILTGGHMGVEPGFVIMGLEPETSDAG